MKQEITEFIENQVGYSLRRTSLPFNCNIETRLYIPDIVIMRGTDISHIVEPETSTGGTTICGKILLANRCIELMAQEGIISNCARPKLIFLYNKSFPHLERVRYRVRKANISTRYLRDMIIDYYPAGWTWL